MKKSLKDVFKLVLPESQDKKDALSRASQYLSPEDLKTLKYYLKMDRCFAKIESWNTSSDLSSGGEWPEFKSHLKEKELQEFLERVNSTITEKSHEEAFKEFSHHALDQIALKIAPGIVGMDYAKRAAALQLFANDPIHVLIIGDPGTGKTEVLRSSHHLAPISSFGLGSGVSGVGLSAAYKGDELMEGLLPMANGGVACIDELNLIKAKDLASLYNAMEKGFVSYDKGGKHEQLPARVRVLATANPKDSTFVGHSAPILRKQIPFEDALLTRFHLIFLIRKPSDEEFERITHQIVKGEKHELKEADARFIKEYAKYARKIEVSLPKDLELKIVGFIQRLKKDEKKFLQEIGPRAVLGVVRMVRAIARSNLETTAREEHLLLAQEIVEDAFYVRRHDED